MSSDIFFPQLSKAYEKGLYSDLKITCGDSEFNVHKIILCSQSKVFHATCSSGFRESSTNTINLTEDGISLVSRMIHLLYHGTYPDFLAEEDDQHWKSAHQLHAAMYALGDKYDMVIVRDTALVHFNNHINNSLPKYLLGFLESIPIIYSSTPESERELRDVAVEKIKRNPSLFLQDDNVKAFFQKVLIEVPEFNWDLHEFWMSLPISRPQQTASSKRKR